MNNDSKLVTQVEHKAPMKDGTPTILYIKETRVYALHVRYGEMREAHKSRSSRACRARIT
jgi:hypothetical protein